MSVTQLLTALGDRIQATVWDPQHVTDMLIPPFPPEYYALPTGELLLAQVVAEETRIEGLLDQMAQDKRMGAQQHQGDVEWIQAETRKQDPLRQQAMFLRKWKYLLCTERTKR